MNARARQQLLLIGLLLTTSTQHLLAQGENMDTIIESNHILAYAVAALLISVFVMAFSNRVFYYREKQEVGKGRQLVQQLGLVLESNHTQVWTYDVKTNLFKTLSNYDASEQSYAPIDFSQFYDPDDFKEMRQQLFSVRDRRQDQATITMRSHQLKGSDEQQRTLVVVITVLRRDRWGRPLTLLGVQRDITDEENRQEKSRKLMLRYHTVFESSLVDMIYYDANGVIKDINNNACQSFAVSDRKELLAQQPNIKDMPSLGNIDFSQVDEMYMSSITRVNDVKKPIGDMEANESEGTIYYEQTLSTVHDKQGKMTGIVSAGRNITEMVQSFHHQQQARRKLEQTTHDIRQYINNINFSLRVSEVRLMNYYPDTHELEIQSDLNKTQYRLAQMRCISLVAPEDYRRARGLFRKMDRRLDGAVTFRIKTILRDKMNRRIIMGFNIMPMRNAEGQITHYFGMCRNDTDVAYTEMKLQEETKKAQETEQLKNTFLLNMSHELRTPLSAVIGFAELFNADHAEEDEPVFAEEIKRNTNELLALINDILYISRLDAHMEELQKSECDFAVLFEGFCYMGLSTVQPNVQVIVENPYSSLHVKLDEQHVGRVIQKFCNLCSQHTSEGTIRAKYEYRQGQIAMSIEDTGEGIDKELLPHAFDRFVRDNNNNPFGTGLDMAIAKELVEQMGGSVELQSEIGKGTSVYFSIPCELISMEKK